MLANDYNKKEENKNNNYNQVKMMKNNNIKKYKLNLNIPIKCRSRTYNKRIYFKKNMSQYFAKKTLENFDIVIENYRRRKDFLIRDFVNPQIIKTERANEKMEFNSDDNRLLKEIIILNKENNKEIEEYKGKSYNNQSSKYKDIKFKKRINSALLNKLTTFENKKENKIIIINKYILRRLFAKNMIKKKKIKSLDIKSISNIEKRILYYNTGRYDMPFVTNLI